MAAYTVLQVSLASDEEMKVIATLKVPTSGKLLPELRLHPTDRLQKLLDGVRGGARLAVLLGQWMGGSVCSFGQNPRANMWV